MRWASYPPFFSLDLFAIDANILKEKKIFQFPLYLNFYQIKWNFQEDTKYVLLQEENNQDARSKLETSESSKYINLLYKSRKSNKWKEKNAQICRIILAWRKRETCNIQKYGRTWNIKAWSEISSDQNDQKQSSRNRCNCIIDAINLRCFCYRQNYGNNK